MKVLKIQFLSSKLQPSVCVYFIPIRYILTNEVVEPILIYTLGRMIAIYRSKREDTLATFRLTFSYIAYFLSITTALYFRSKSPR